MAYFTRKMGGLAKISTTIQDVFFVDEMVPGFAQLELYRYGP